MGMGILTNNFYTNQTNSLNAILAEMRRFKLIEESNLSKQTKYELKTKYVMKW